MTTRVGYVELRTRAHLEYIKRYGDAPPPPDGVRLLRGRAYMDGTGQVLLHIHKRNACSGRPCVIHRPSGHAMRSFPTHFRFDRYLMERVCPHGVGHPDPDDVAFQERELPGRAAGIHGCDGCCRG